MTNPSGRMHDTHSTQQTKPSHKKRTLFFFYFRSFLTFFFFFFFQSLITPSSSSYPGNSSNRGNSTTCSGSTLALFLTAIHAFSFGVDACFASRKESRTSTLLAVKVLRAHLQHSICTLPCIADVHLADLLAVVSLFCRLGLSPRRCISSSLYLQHCDTICTLDEIQNAHSCCEKSSPRSASETVRTCPCIADAHQDIILLAKARIAARLAELRESPSWTFC